MINSYLHRTICEGADFSKIQLCKSILAATIFKNSNLHKADFTDVCMNKQENEIDEFDKECSFVGANLSEVIFYNCDFGQAIFDNADLTNSKFNLFSDFFFTNFNSANMTGTKLIFEKDEDDGWNTGWKFTG
jgi:uncharacterized protein YjbI with pentapeptide repeats